MPQTASTSPKKLTPKQAAFVAEYLIDLNGTRSAIAAGYSAKTAGSIGVENLTKPLIRDAIKTAMDERAARLKIDADEILRELTLLCRSDVRDFVVDNDGTLLLRDGVRDEAWRSVASVKHKINSVTQGDLTETTREIEIKLWPKVSAIQTAREHLGLHIQKVQHSGEIASGGVLVVPGAIDKDSWSIAATAQQQALVAKKTKLSTEYGVD